MSLEERGGVFLLEAEVLVIGGPLELLFYLFYFNLLDDHLYIAILYSSDEDSFGLFKLCLWGLLFLLGLDEGDRDAGVLVLPELIFQAFYGGELFFEKFLL